MRRDEIKDYLETKEMERMFVMAKDYVIEDTSEGKFIGNKEEGIRIKVPENWKIERETTMFAWESKRTMLLYSPDLNFRDPMGCAIEMEIIRLKDQEDDFLARGVEEVKEDIEYWKNKDVEENDDYYIEIIKVDDYQALKETSEKLAIIEIPVGIRVYSFMVALLSERCSAELDKFLETVLID